MMRIAIGLSTLLWVLALVIRIQWILPSQATSIELAMGGVFVMRNAEGFHGTGVGAQLAASIPLTLPASVQYTTTLAATFVPLWWIPLALLASTRLTWLLRIMVVVDVLVMLRGLAFAVAGALSSAQAQVDPDRLVPLAVGIPLLFLGYKGLRAVWSYRRNPDLHSAIIVNVWLTAAAWGLAALFGQTTVLPLVALTILALLVTLNLRGSSPARAPAEAATVADEETA